jgi:oligoendopeptidase F
MLENRAVSDRESFLEWFKDYSELTAAIAENSGWRYIKMTRFTEDENFQQMYQQFIREIQPKMAPWEDKLNRKALEFPGFSELQTAGYPIIYRSIKKEVDIFREKNIPINTQVQTLAQEYQGIIANMSIEHNGKELTLQQAGTLLESTDRSLRESVYLKINERRKEDSEKLNDIFNSLVKLRDQIARHADFDNFRDYMFAQLGRFDYSPDDCFAFHSAIEAEVMPLLTERTVERKQKMGLDPLRPWDLAVDPLGRPKLKPFDTTEELLEKTITCFSRIDPFFGECLQQMKDRDHLDLDSRKAKAPGGYNYPLYESGLPFIFMNAAGTLRDLVTLMHEGGHAVHSVLTHELPLVHFKSTPSEIAELASMTMELISMDHWDLFFDNKEELVRAKKEHLEQVIATLPWVAVIDKFQHWIYEHPDHTTHQRAEAWNEILNRYTPNLIHYEGLEIYRNIMWQKQLHLYEVPFYYIEYGMAQLGAIAVWRNYKENPGESLNAFKEALSLGYTKTIPDTYEKAGIRFDFSKEYIQELMNFVRGEIDKLDAL